MATCLPEGAVNRIDGQGDGAMTRGDACGLPPMVERTVPTYVVGWVGDDNMAVRVAEGGTVGAKASLSEGGNTGAALRLATAQFCAVPAISWCPVSTTETIAAISAAVESRAQPAASFL